MAASILICVDMEEMEKAPESGQMRWTNDPNRIDRCIRDISVNWPNSTICVYRLSELQKLKEAPKYQRYKVSNEGEIIPT